MSSSHCTGSTVHNSIIHKFVAVAPAFEFLKVSVGHKIENVSVGHKIVIHQEWIIVLQVFYVSHVTG